MNKAHEFISRSPEQTQSLGQTWGREAAGGLVIGLSGDLGMGKTQLVKGLAQGLGIAQKISSPTFALVNEYSEGRLPLFHIDLYRLDTKEQIIAAGLEEYFHQRRGVTVIEWIERWIGKPSNFIGQTPPAPNFRLVQLVQISETERRIIYEDFGN